MINPQNTAWLLSVTPNCRIALAECELIEFKISMQLYKVPLAASHCSDIVLWQNKPAPVMHLSMLLGDDAAFGSAAGFCVIAYQNAEGTPVCYVTLPVMAPPEKITISETQACDPPKDIDHFWSLPDLSYAFFSLDGRTVPIVNINELCAERNRELFSLLYGQQTTVDARSCA